MRKYHTEAEIIGILKEHDAGLKTEELCRKHGICSGTFYRWKAKFGGMELSEAKRLKALEQENGRLKRIVANQALDIEALKAINSKNF